MPPRRASQRIKSKAHQCKFPLTELPVELIHRIFDTLQTEDVIAARLCCMLLAEVGKSHLLDEVVTVYKRDRLERLAEIASHPYFSRHVKSFYFQAARFDSTISSYAQWNHERRDILPRKEMPRPRCVTDLLDKSHLSKGQHCETELRQAYDAYVEAVHDQGLVAAESLDKRCLTKFFQQCSRLEEVTLAIYQGPKRFDMARLPYKDCMVYPEGDTTILERGVDQFRDVMSALSRSGRALKRFTAAEISPRVIGLNVRSRANDAVLSVMQNLHELRITFFVDVFTTKDDSVDLQNEADLHFNSGVLASWLAAAPELRVLKLRMFDDDDDINMAADIPDIFRDTTWPKLHELGLSQFQCAEDDLVDLLLRHKNSLRRLSLSYLTMYEGTWESFFERIGGQLSKLVKVKLRGTFLDNSHGPDPRPYRPDFDFEVPGTESGRICQFRDAVELFVLHGGDYPDRDELPEFDEEGFLIRGQYMDLVPEYVPPSLIFSDDEYLSDGSVVSFGSDGLDVTI